MIEQESGNDSWTVHTYDSLSIAAIAMILTLSASSVVAGGHSLGNVYSAFNVEGMMEVLPKPKPLARSEAEKVCKPTSFAFASPEAEREFMRVTKGSTSIYVFWSRQWGEYWFKERAYSFNGRQECWDQQLIASKMQEALGDRPTGMLTVSQVNRFATTLDRELQRRRSTPDDVVTQTPSTSSRSVAGDTKRKTRAARVVTDTHLSRDNVARYQRVAPIFLGPSPEEVSAAVVDQTAQWHRDNLAKEQAREDEARRQQAADENLRQQNEWARRVQQEEDNARRMQQQY